ncbi:MAG TPA: D-aminoacylase [Flavitalea sp.]|nr:D-aminoacylase [Flavitalea sp.]
MKRLFFCVLLIIPYISFTQQAAADIVITNGKIIDGSGNNWYYGDVAIRDGKIIKVGDASGYAAGKIIDAEKKIVAPGFIDVHGHIEAIVQRPEALNYLHNGVTTVITGNCGGSARDISDFFRQVDSAQTGINVATLVGHNTVRTMVMQHESRKPTSEEQQRMEELVEKAMLEGALGMSTGLIYIPGTFSETEEVVDLAKVAAKHRGIYVSHIRNEGNSVEKAVDEAIEIGRQSGAPVQISHFKVSSKALWGHSKRTIGMVEEARRNGYDVTIDQYPYTASSTNLNSRLPSWVFSGGRDSALYRLKDPATRKKIKEEAIKNIRNSGFKNFGFAAVANYAADTSFNGKTIAEINRLMGRKNKITDQAETIMDMVEKGGAQMVYHTMSEEDVKYIMQYPFAMFGADAGVPAYGVGAPHPRGYGTNARVLGRYVREMKVISLEEAIRRMTSLAATRFGITDRGLIREGMAADIVIFDEDAVSDNATFQTPHAYSSGFDHVIVNGNISIQEGKASNDRYGKSLRKLN